MKTLTNQQDWIKEITIADVPKSFHGLVEAIGIEATYQLAVAYPGMGIYVPKPEALVEKKRNEMICRDVRIIGYRETARKYNLTEVWIRQIADHKKDDLTQIPMFD